MTIVNNQTTGKYKVKFTSSAADELKDIIRYIAKDNKTAAQKMKDDIINKTRSVLGNSPMISRALTEYPEIINRGYRRFLPHPNYSVLYIINGQTVEIMHIWDNRRDWTRLFK